LNRAIYNQVVAILQVILIGELETWINRGSVLCKLGKHNGAIQCYDIATEIIPNNAYVWYNKCLLLHKLERYKEANQWLIKTNWAISGLVEQSLSLFNRRTESL
jgi:tetratricopeptide (TPR) repeat protein